MSGKRAPGPGSIVEDLNTVEPTTEQERLAADLQRLHDLLESDQVEQARRFVKELEQRWPEAERVQHFAKVLAPPKVRSRPDIPARSRSQEMKWLKEHAHEYPGCWLAIHGGDLIAADPDRRVVIAKAREILGEEGALLFRQPERPNPH
jgi:hypothetical protein